MYDDEPELRGEDSRVLQRLGFDVVASTDAQHAVVHATPETVARLEAVARSLPTESRTIQARWAIIDSFEPIPSEHRVEAAWLASLPPNAPVDAIVEMQPLLSRVEAGDIAHAITELFRRDSGEAILRMGADFSGRYWLRARMLPATIRAWC